MKMKPISKVKITAFFGTVLLALCAAGAKDRDRFEYDPTPKKPPAATPPKRGGGSSGGGSSTAPGGSVVTLALGEAREAYNAAGSEPEMAFYLPETNPTVAQVVIERKFLRSAVYFVKGIRPGTVTGGIVPRSCLDKAGFRPKNIAEEARIQAAIKAQPITIRVR